MNKKYYLTDCSKKFLKRKTHHRETGQTISIENQFTDLQIAPANTEGKLLALRLIDAI